MAAPPAEPPAPAQAAAVRGASLLILLQILSRAVTFLANQLLLRFLTAQLLGVATQLEVYYLSVLFFARESLRVALQRQTTDDSNSTKDDVPKSTARGSQAVVNIAHISLLLGLVTSVGLGWAYLSAVDQATASTPYLDTSLYIYGFAAVIELLSEPAFVALQHRLRFGPRAAAESIATFLRCLSTFAAANWAWPAGLELGVLPFAIGQLAYGVGLLGVYTWYGTRLASAEGFSLLPRTPVKSGGLQEKAGKEKEDRHAPPSPTDKYALGYFYKPTLQLASSLVAQSLVKHLLTQGDTFLVSIFSSPQSQGVYALANNYGSLLARLVFQPIEESSRNYFSKLLSTSDAKVKPEKQSVEKARIDLQALMKFYALLSIIVTTIGPFAAPILVQIIAGSRWSSSGAGKVLAVYCLYIPLLAVNGITEAFVSSVATKSEVHRQSIWMGAFSIAFGVAGFVSLRVLQLGATGLVCANGINMLCRVIWSTAFISRYFRANDVTFDWQGTLPKGMALHVAGAAVLWSILTKAGIVLGAPSSHVFKDLVVVGAAAVPYVATLAFTEREYLLQAYQSLRGRR
ncbi:Rft protein-domain-containing protein [Microdochium trichocladiopsis]|uniref:Man(5)GlcNAc(2)-PP-dolichol translocation protein RFT1 n=1 Tax=Microdochium trichocladiopsis TaxID=1682393 RepID=A0A9P8Y5F2_9PEZI|nr:Rft protein-domain-containing protein [Microdochium trichocladiopsis]KAH7030671.1 Rft protein-domain-containing protein [Microdochium trichocladiopsis]